MYILAIETTGKEGSAALLACEENGQNAEIISEKKITGQMNHLKELIPSVDAVLKKAGVFKNEIDCIAPSVGPGSFTGIRIGVSTARALSQALGLEKAVRVPTLRAFLYKEEAQKAKTEGTVCCAIINARRGQVYGVIDGFLTDGPYMLNDVLEIIKTRVFAESKSVLFFGDGIDAYEKEINEALSGLGTYDFAEETARYQDAKSAAIFAAANMEENLVGIAELLPDYMRMAEAGVRKISKKTGKGSYGKRRRTDCQSSTGSGYRGDRAAGESLLCLAVEL